MKSPTPRIEFVSDGRVYVPDGKRSGEFVVLFGSLVMGPTAPPPGSTVLKFVATVTMPDGTTVRPEEAHVDYPIGDEGGYEGPFVLLRGDIPHDLPAGTRVTSESADT